jgi:hypothetical protein
MARHIDPGRKGPGAGGGVFWTRWRLGLVLYPFATSAVAINLFMLGLLWQAVGLPALTPVATLWLSLPLGLPATWAAARWVRRLMDEAER